MFISFLFMSIASILRKPKSEILKEKKKIIVAKRDELFKLQTLKFNSGADYNKIKEELYMVNLQIEIINKQIAKALIEEIDICETIPIKATSFKATSFKEKEDDKK